MAVIRAMILRAAGTNCDAETEHAWHLAGAETERVHVNQLCAAPNRLDAFHVLTIPGGFSYGDDIAAGRIFARRIERALLDALRTFVDHGGLVLGICNGFQVLVRCGLLPGSMSTTAARSCTITHNDPPGFQDRWVCLEAGQRECAFLEPKRRYEMPIAHGEGRIAFADSRNLEHTQTDGRAVLRYVALSEDVDAVGLPANPNGSAGDIAGFCDETGRVLGLMPHPERFVTWTQHPVWTSTTQREPGDGLAMFQRAVAWCSR